MTGYKQKEIEHVKHTHISKMHFMVINLFFRGMHAHSDLEIMLILEGTLHFCAEKDFDAIPGDVVLINSGQAHSCYTSSGNCIALVIQIDLSFCEPYYPNIHNIRFQESHLTPPFTGI